MTSKAFVRATRLSFYALALQLFFNRNMITGDSSFQELNRTETLSVYATTVCTAHLHPCSSIEGPFGPTTSPSPHLICKRTG